MAGAKQKKTPAKHGKAKPKHSPEDLLAVMVLDDSASMEYNIGGANVVESVDEYLEGLREDERESEGKTLLSLSLLNGHARGRDVHVVEPISEIPSVSWYRPRNGTPLFDAIARSIKLADAKLRELGTPEMKVLHITVSDGQENQSSDYPNQSSYGYGVPFNSDLKALVQEYQYLTFEERQTLTDAAKQETITQRVAANEPRGWTFVYLGAEKTRGETVAVGASAGYIAENSMTYAASQEGVSSTMGNLRSATKTRKKDVASTSSSFFEDAGQTPDDYVAPVPGSGAAPGPADPPKTAGSKLRKMNNDDLYGGER